MTQRVKPALGLRDKTIFLAARAEHYWVLILILMFPLPEQLAGAQLLTILIWWGAALSKLNRHFPSVVTVMLSNSPTHSTGSSTAGPSPARCSAGTSAAGTCTTSSCSTRCGSAAGFAPGEQRVIMLESQPIQRQRQHYRIVDAATGLVEQGYVAVRDMADRQPWLSDAPPPSPSR